MNTIIVCHSKARGQIPTPHEGRKGKRRRKRIRRKRRSSRRRERSRGGEE